MQQKKVACVCTHHKNSTKVTLSHLWEIRTDERYFTSKTAEVLVKDKHWYICVIHIKLINGKLRLV